MAVICPRCANPVEQDFGVATCGHCSAVLFVNMDGEAQITEEGVIQESPLVSEAPVYEFSGNSEPEPVPPFEMRGIEEPESVLLQEAAEVGEFPQVTAEPPLEENSEATGIFESSEQVLGALSYSIKIENIDTKEIRHSLIQALDDLKFQWDPREILRSLKEGTIELQNLNPVKASIVVRRVRDLPVKVSWKQHVYN